MSDLKFLSSRLLILSLLLVSMQFFTQATAFASDDDVYVKQIKPLLRDKCFSCHGANKQEGGLRLDAASLIQRGGDSGPILVAGKPEQSLLLRRITAGDEDRMPPASEGAALTQQEIQHLQHWISSGAAAPTEAIPQHPSQHWSFQQPVIADVPHIDAPWIRSEIDRFLAAQQERAGTRAVGPADRTMLLRRASLAVTGLPPTPAELSQFLNDTTADAYEKAVDRLLNSPRYGERWARPFMDLWRYSDPSGYGDEIRDGRQHIWRWRDWIVESLNSDTGYDQLIVQMLAADEAMPEDQQALRATGFLARNWYKFNRNVWLDNIVEHSSKAFLGLTMNCARCHAHKYDPFSHQAYYRMRAIFETHDVRDDPFAVTPVAGSAADADLLVRTYDAHLDRNTFLFQQGNEDRPDEANPLTPGLPELLGELQVIPVEFPVTVWYPALQQQNRDAAVTAAGKSHAAAEQAIQAAAQQVVLALQKLAEFQQTAAKAPQPPDTPNAPPQMPREQPLLVSDFAALDQQQWTIEAGIWKAADGRITQSVGATDQHRLVSTVDHPRNFRMRTTLKITGGDQYRSVGVGFDGNGLAMNSVYLSASGNKLQFTTQNPGGTWQYPAAGAVPFTVNVNQDYLLELAVRDRLLNVLLDGDLVLAYQLPERKAGRFSLWAFSATAEFDHFELTTLSQQVQLQPPAGAADQPARPLTETDLQLALQQARAAAAAAESHLQVTAAALNDLQARTAAELVRYELAGGDLAALQRAAGSTHRELSLQLLNEQLAKAELEAAEARVRKATAPPAETAKHEQELQAALKKIADLQPKREAAAAAAAEESSDYPALGPQYPKSSSGRRLAFARWITSPRNPLTARVLVNHVWMRHFDAPLVERTFDFGLRSEEPQHAQLLDWLAVTFMQDGWSLKQLHRRILTSGAYRLSSSPASASPATLAADPDNQTLWRMNTRRMEAEVVRDSILALGGSLDLTSGGPPVEHTQGQTVLRRSLYFRQDKERQMTFLSLFDGAKVSECYERQATVAPQQALAMFNSPIAAGQAERIAAAYAQLDSSEFVKALFTHVLCRSPTEDELAECASFLSEFSDSGQIRTQLALVLLNHNDFVSIR